VPGLHPALSVRFRPALAEARFEHLRANDLNAKEQVLRVAKVLGRLVVVLQWVVSRLRSRTGRLLPDSAKIRSSHS
jgi:hypothetical protein